MNFNEKLTAAKEVLAATGMKRRLYAPSFVAFLWRLGIQVPPPHFAGFLGTSLFAGTLFGTLWGVLMWFLRWSHDGVTPGTAVAYAALAAIIPGLAAATYYRYSARKHAIPRWSDFAPERR